MVIEASLDGCDIFCVVKDRAGSERVFKLILLSTLEIEHPKTKERLERLSLLTGGEHVAIVLLLSGEGSLAMFGRIQVE